MTTDMQPYSSKPSIPRDKLRAATRRVYRAAGRRIDWREARRRARAMCAAEIAGVEPVLGTLGEECAA